MLGKRESARLDGCYSAETTKEAQKVAFMEDSRPTDLLAAASQVRTEQCSDKEKVEKRNISVEELEPGPIRSRYNPTSCVDGYKWESEGSAFGHCTTPEHREQ